MAGFHAKNCAMVIPLLSRMVWIGVGVAMPFPVVVLVVTVVGFGVVVGGAVVVGVVEDGGGSFNASTQYEN